ncbi:MAG: hypothetical protein M1817_003279 [Caeruleum heppii]|nr:MAG: hypothetical protein M1817_003279 [Caeruleum heppii]
MAETSAAGLDSSIDNPLQPSPPGGNDDAPDQPLTNTEEQAAGDAEDVAMVGASDTANPVKSPRDPSTSTPAVVSDNPLDAPDAPRLAEDDIAGEDEEMGGTGAETKEDGSPEKNGDTAAATTAQDGAATDQPAQTKASIASSARSHLIAQTHAIILPSYSTWFDMHIIHNLEKKALPEFFNNRNRSKTPIVYKDYRDFMINTYRLNPTEYLTVTACRRNLAGDVCAIMRVHAFLEQWGLINYQIDPDTRPSNIGPPFTGHFRVTADTPRGLQTFQPAPRSTITPGKPFAGTDQAVSATPAPKSDLNLEIRRDIYDSTGKPLSTTPDTKPVENQANGEPSTANGTTADSTAVATKASSAESQKLNFCSSCGIDCTRVRYHNAKTIAPSVGGATTPAKVKFDICPNCFMEARFLPSLSAVDFVKLEDPNYSVRPSRDTQWTDAEMLLLLEGLELFDENWTSVAEHVGTRTREECVLKFLQLEIEDKYYQLEAPIDTGDKSFNDGLGPPNLAFLNGGRVPFAQADNPVLSVVGFLAGLADPEVAAQAAGKSAEEMRNSLRRQIQQREDAAAATTNPAAASSSSPAKEGAAPSSDGADGTTAATDKGKGKEAPKTEDAMDVDVSSSAPPVQPDTTTTIVTSSTDLPSSSTTIKPTSTSTSKATAATVPLALAAARSTALSSHLERQMTSLVSAALNTQLQKFSLKLQHFDEMERLLQAERRELDRARRQLFADRVVFRKRVREWEESDDRTVVGGGEQGGVVGLEKVKVGGGGEGEEVGPLSGEGVRTFEI